MPGAPAAAMPLQAARRARAPAWVLLLLALVLSAAGLVGPTAATAAAAAAATAAAEPARTRLQGAQDTSEQTAPLPLPLPLRLAGRALLQGSSGQSGSGAGHRRHHSRHSRATGAYAAAAGPGGGTPDPQRSLPLPRPLRARPWGGWGVGPGADRRSGAPSASKGSRGGREDDDEDARHGSADAAPAAASAAAVLDAQRAPPPPPPPPPPPDGDGNGTATIAELIDRALDKEFASEAADGAEAAAATGATFTAAASSKPAAVETVVRISGGAKPRKEGGGGDGGDGGDRDGAEASGDGSAVGDGGGGGGSGSGGDGSGDSAPSPGALEPVEVGVDRIIDAHDNTFVLSAPKSGAVSSLTLDPLLVQDLTLTLVSAAGLGCLFEAVKQPVINGYLVAGAVIGPGGLQLIKELVQVESLAQLGVQLLLFGLGRELSLAKLRPVLRVAALGGSLQIAVLMAIGGAAGALLGGGAAGAQQGLFVGALLSMSSTSVVVKCLEATRASGTVYGQLSIGTLILQDCSVGLMFALLPAFAHRRGGGGGAAAVGVDAAAAAAAAAAAGLDPGVAGATAAAAADSEAFVRAAVVLLVLRVLCKLAVALAVAWAAARFVLPPSLRALASHASKELVQLSLVAFCLASAWVCGQAELSEELGAFLAGATMAAAERRALAGGGGGGAAAAAAQRAGASPPPAAHGSGDDGCLGAAAAHGAPHGGGAPGHQGPGVCSIESLSNVLAALFVASIGLIMSPVFLWHHAGVLVAATLVVMAVKAAVVAGTVRLFGVPPRTAWAVGLTMAHTGEFAFVLLSMARQLSLLPENLYMLLLGVTAVSLLTTPLVIQTTHRLLEGGTPLYHSLAHHHKQRVGAGAGVGGLGARVDSRGDVKRGLDNGDGDP